MVLILLPSPAIMEACGLSFLGGEGKKWGKKIVYSSSSINYKMHLY